VRVRARAKVRVRVRVGGGSRDRDRMRVRVRRCRSVRARHVVRWVRTKGGHFVRVWGQVGLGFRIR